MANQLVLEGKIFKIDPTQQIKDTFKKREFIIETEEQYPQKVKFEFTQDKCDQLGPDSAPAYGVGERVKVSFNIRGSEWQGKFYVNLQAWRIERNTGDQQSAPAQNQNNNYSNQTSQPVVQTPPAFSNTTTAQDNSNDDLPF